jgi:hypothetical protein
LSSRLRVVVNVAGAAVAAAALGGLARAAAGGEETDFDDAYMFLRYARNLLAGHGLAWNAGDPVNGVTGLLHLGLVTLLLAAAPGLPDGRLLQAVSTGTALLALVGLAAIAARAARSPALRGSAGVWAALLVAPLALDDAFVFHARTGMDTHAALLANTLLAAAALGLRAKPSASRALATAAAAYVAYVARPDSGLYALGVPALVLALGGAGRRAWRPLGVFVAAALGLVAIDLAVRRLALGSALPLAFHAKRPGAYGGFAGEHTWNTVLFLRVFLVTAAPFLAAVAILGDRKSGREAVAWLAPVAVTFAALFWPRHIMGHMGRFFFPALPFVVVPAALALDRFVERVSSRADAGDGPPGLRGLAARAVGVALGVPLIGLGLARAATAFEAPAATQRLAPLEGLTPPPERSVPDMDSWRAAQEIALVARAAPPGSVFAMSEHGLVAAAAPHVHIVDVLGLHDRTFALAPFRAAALFARAPDLLWMPHPDHTQMLHDILTSPALRDGYVLLPDAFKYGLALRRASPRFAALWGLVAGRWRTVYPGVPIEAHVAGARAQARPPSSPPPSSGTIAP